MDSVVYTVSPPVSAILPAGTSVPTPSQLRSTTSVPTPSQLRSTTSMAATATLAASSVERPTSVPGDDRGDDASALSAADASALSAADALPTPNMSAGSDVILEVECGPNKARLYLNRLQMGSKGACVLYDLAWLTPNEFQYVSGRETAKDWKRSIKHYGKSLKILMAKGELSLQPARCRCEMCGSTDSKRTSKPSGQEDANLVAMQTKSTEAEGNALQPASGQQPEPPRPPDKCFDVTDCGVHHVTCSPLLTVPLNLSPDMKRKRKKKKKKNKKKKGESSYGNKSGQIKTKKTKKNRERKKKKLAIFKVPFVNCVSGVSIASSLSSVVKNIKGVSIECDENVMPRPSLLLSPYCNSPSQHEAATTETNNIPAAGNGLANTAHATVVQAGYVTKDNILSHGPAPVTPVMGRPRPASAGLLTSGVDSTPCTDDTSTTSVTRRRARSQDYKYRCEEIKSPVREDRMKHIIAELRSRKKKLSNSAEASDDELNSSDDFDTSHGRSASLAVSNDLNQSVTQPKEGDWAPCVPASSPWGGPNSWLWPYYAGYGLMTHVALTPAMTHAMTPAMTPAMYTGLLQLSAPAYTMPNTNRNSSTETQQGTSAQLRLGHQPTNTHSPDHALNLSSKRALSSCDDSVGSSLDKPLDLTVKRRKTDLEIAPLHSSTLIHSPSLSHPSSLDDTVLDLSKKAAENDSKNNNICLTAKPALCKPLQNHKMEDKCEVGFLPNMNPKNTGIVSPSVNWCPSLSGRDHLASLPTCLSPRQHQMLQWTASDVVKFISTVEKCSKYSKVVEELGVTGCSLPFLTVHHMMSALGMQREEATCLRLAIDRLLVIC